MVGQAGDRWEQEADAVANQVMSMSEPTFECTGTCGGEQLQAKRTQGEDPPPATVPASIDEALGSPGRPLDASLRTFFEARFGSDLGPVWVHTDDRAAESAEVLSAQAYTVGTSVVFARNRYAPHTEPGRRLLAHELAHVLQQRGAGTTPSRVGALSPLQHPRLQRTIGDGHDLASPRFSKLEDLEAAYDAETKLKNGSVGRGVQAIQQALRDIGYALPLHGADGQFGSETEAAVKKFQRDHPPLADDGEVGEKTMAALDGLFGAPVLPAAAARSAPWTPACVRSILCPWSPHTVEVLRTRITLKSFDSLSWADEKWDGAAWVPDPFPGAGYNTGTEIGVVNSSCEEMVETLYHEVLHAEQPSTQRTTLQKEAYAYRIGEEFSIAMGLGGDPSLRSTDPRGREFADPAKVGAFVATAYPSVPAGGGGDQIIGKAVTLGDVRVQRPNGTIYTRPAAVGEKVPGPEARVNEVTHPTAGWTCP